MTNKLLKRFSILAGLCFSVQASAPAWAISALTQIPASGYTTQSGIQLETSAEGGQNVAFIDNGDYTSYNNVEFATGAATFSARVASNAKGGAIEIRTGSATGTLAGTCAVPGTGGWQNWTTVTCPVTGLNNTQTVFLRYTGGAGNLFNVRWFSFTAPTPPAISAFLQIEAENFTSQSGIQTENSSEGGRNVGFTDNGDFLFFERINFAAGAASFTARVASNGPGGNLEVRTGSSTGKLASSCSVPPTGGWQKWITVTCPVSGLSGVQPLYIRFAGVVGRGNLLNLNWFRFNTAVVQSSTIESSRSSVPSSLSSSSRSSIVSSSSRLSVSSSSLSSVRSSSSVSSISSLSSSLSSASSVAVAALTLPIEVLGAGDPYNPTIVAVPFNLDTNGVASASRLQVKVHRPGFYNSPEFETLSKPLTAVAASFRVVGSGSTPNVPWVDIANQSVTIEENALAHGGVNGGLLTVDFSVVFDGATKARLATGINRIEFRFNGTDGNSNGFRVLDFQVQNSSGKDLLLNARQWVDINAEKIAGRTWTSDASAGQALWHGRNILVKSSIVQSRMRAACADCHATDGRDIQYFNYSNNAIVQRSRFHGLSDQQGRQIAAYLRASLADKVPHVAAATPWNPPYQPGPGLDSKPVVEWAAGAGLGAVLPDARSFVNVFVGKAPDNSATVTQAELDNAMSPARGRVLNTREMAIPLQFPDWNAWLPITSPLDIWTPEPGQTQGLFETQGDNGSNPIKTYKRIFDYLNANKNPNGVYGDWSHLTAAQRETIQYWLDDMGKGTLNFIGGGRGSRTSGDASKPFGGEIGGKKLQALLSPQTQLEASNAYPFAKGGFTKDAFIERALFGAIHWMGVKQWELAHTFGLEGNPAQLHGRREGNNWIGEGEKRGWTFSWPSVFYMAPHMLFAPEWSNNRYRENHFSWEPRLISFYRTNQWYQLQMTVNPGWAGASSGPMDWPYHMGFTTAVVDDLVTAKAPAGVSATHLARYFQVRTKLAQLANTDLPLNQPDPREPANLFKNLGHNSKASLVVHKLGVGEIVDRGPENWERSRFRLLDDAVPGLHLKFINSSLSLYNALYANTRYEEWRRCDPNALFGSELEVKSGFRFCLDQQVPPLPLNNQGQPHLVGGWVDWTSGQYIKWGAISARNHGADPARLQVLDDWIKRMWP